MQYGFLRPLALVEIIGVFGKSRQVYDTEIAAACREIEGGWFANVVETSPNELPRTIGRVLHNIPCGLVSCAPRRARVIVRRAKKRGVDKRTTLTWQTPNGIAGHSIKAAGLQSRYALGHQEWLSGEILGHIGHLLAMIVKANNVYRTTFKQVVVGRNLVASSRYKARGVVTTYDIGQPTRKFGIVAKPFVSGQTCWVACVI